MVDLPTVRDAMTNWELVLSPEADLVDAIRELVAKRCSGAAVVDKGHLVGVLTEKDALRVLANRAYGERTGGLVRQYMSTVKAEVTPDMDIFAVTNIFLQNNFPALPVTLGGSLVGRISRQDLLREAQRFNRARRRQGAAQHSPRRPPRSIDQMQRAAASHTTAQLREVLKDRDR